MLTISKSDFFYWLCTGRDGGRAPWHNSYYATDDDALELGAKLLAQSVLTVQIRE